MERWKEERSRTLQEEEDKKVKMEYDRFEAIIKEDIERCKHSLEHITTNVK